MLHVFLEFFRHFMTNGGEYLHTDTHCASGCWDMLSAGRASPCSRDESHHMKVPLMTKLQHPFNHFAPSPRVFQGGAQVTLPISAKAPQSAPSGADLKLYQQRRGAPRRRKAAPPHMCSYLWIHPVACWGMLWKWALHSWREGWAPFVFTQWLSSEHLHPIQTLVLLRWRYFPAAGQIDVSMTVSSFLF